LRANAFENVYNILHITISHSPLPFFYTVNQFEDSQFDDQKEVKDGLPLFQPVSPEQTEVSKL
jgi:hypothetical protein